PERIQLSVLAARIGGPAALVGGVQQRAGAAGDDPGRLGEGVEGRVERLRIQLRLGGGGDEQVARRGRVLRGDGRGLGEHPLPGLLRIGILGEQRELGGERGIRGEQGELLALLAARGIDADGAGVTAESGSVRSELDGTIAVSPPAASTSSRVSGEAVAGSICSGAARGTIPVSVQTSCPCSRTAVESWSVPAASRLRVSAWAYGMASTVRCPTASSSTPASSAESGSGVYSRTALGSSPSLGSTARSGGSSSAGSSHQSTSSRCERVRSAASRPDSAEAANSSGSVTMAAGSSAANGSSTDWVIVASASAGRHTTKVRSVDSGCSSAVTVSARRRVPQ